MKKQKKKAVPEEGMPRVANLNLKSLKCDPRLKEGASRILCRIWGKVRGIHYNTDTKRGDSYSVLVGLFEGQTPGGPVIQSTRLYLPAGVQEVMEAGMKAAGGEDYYLQFALEIASEKSEAPIGYQIKARELFKHSVVHELGDIRAAIAPKKGAPEKV